MAETLNVAGLPLTQPLEGANLFDRLHARRFENWPMATPSSEVSAPQGHSRNERRLVWLTARTAGPSGQLAGSGWIRRRCRFD